MLQLVLILHKKSFSSSKYFWLQNGFMSKGFWNSFTYACLKFCLSQSHFVLWDYSQIKLTKSTKRQLY